jgi:hypothetical protein
MKEHRHRHAPAQKYLLEHPQCALEKVVIFWFKVPTGDFKVVLASLQIS